MKEMIFMVLLVFVGRIVHAQASVDQIALNRIEYIYSLKSLVDENIWKGFSDEEFDVSLIYYTKSNCYITNPTGHFIDSYQPDLLFDSGELKIYRTILLDSIPFHMSASIILGDSTADYNYRVPHLKCSSFEITESIIQDVRSTEEWATMIIHEYFHGFQYRHQAFLDYFEKVIAHVSADSLKSVYNNSTWFKESVDRENDFLIAAIAAKDEIETYAHIDSFLQLREKRRLLSVDTSNFDLSSIEQAYETMEGTARYVEYSLYSQFALSDKNEKKLLPDSSFRYYEKYRNYSIEQDPWLFRTELTTYFYATGFNIVRLLDKLGIEYKSRLFREGGLSLEQLLKNGG